jgi:pimeloyl-ACP methyl ester carboxylesterase
LSASARAEAAALFSNDHKLAKIHIPVLILHGERDNLISPAHARLNYSMIPQGQGTLKILPGVGHNDLLRLADDYFGAIKDFTQKAK